MRERPYPKPLPASDSARRGNQKHALSKVQRSKTRRCGSGPIQNRSRLPTVREEEIKNTRCRRCKGLKQEDAGAALSKTAPGFRQCAKRKSKTRAVEGAKV